MTEERLRELHKKYLEDPTDKWAKYRYRLECVRIGRLEEAGLEVGDSLATAWGVTQVIRWLPTKEDPSGRADENGRACCLCFVCMRSKWLLSPALPSES